MNSIRETWNERTTRPIRKWNKDLIILHDDFSDHLLVSCASILTLDQSGLRGIILHVHHSAAGFVSTAASKYPMAMQIDMGYVSIWLTGIE